MQPRTVTPISVRKSLQTRTASTAPNKGVRPAAATTVGSGISTLKHDEQSKPVKPTSQKKIEANRINGRNKSTGPKTARGKSHSRRNALKHGILAEGLLIIDKPGAEDNAAFYRHLEKLRRDWEPVGEREHHLVEKIAVLDWREQRVLRTEAGLISRRVVVHGSGRPPELVALEGSLGRSGVYECEPELKNLTDYLSLPLGNPLDRLLRYETTIDRKRARAINELLRLQLARKGNTVPPPVNIELLND